MRNPSPKMVNKQQEREKTITLQGIIIPSAWDKDGNVITISLSTFDEEEYCIGGDHLWRELMALLREKVRIRGVVSRKKGKQTIWVKDFKRIAQAEVGAP